jgi:hypothetical protein
VNKRFPTLAACVVTIAACKQVVPDANQPAVIVDPDDSSRAALQAAVNEELGTDVLLADDALTDTSILIVERKMPRAITGSPAQGRTMDAPVRFTLMTNGSDCVLVEDAGGTRYLLADTRCEPR